MKAGMKAKLCAAILAVAAVTPALAHRLDEYLQGTILSIGKTQVQGQMTLTPGVAVFPFLIADIDSDGDGAISETEQRAYAERVLRDLSLSADGRVLEPRLVSIQFPALDEMKEGRGGIRLDFRADLSRGGYKRKLVLENRHRSGISAYQVNCLVPRDADIRITAQSRNYSQSRYELEYVQADVPPDSMASVWTGRLAWLSPAGIFLMWVGRRVWRAQGRMSAIPDSSSIVFRSGSADSVSTTSRVGRT